MKIKKLTFTTRYVLLVGILLLVASMALGFTVLQQSKKSMKTLINKNMLDVVKSAAGTLDGDALGALTEEDVDGPVFRHIEDQLTVFTDTVDIHFIYAVKQVGPDHFVFTVDPDPVDPGAFGEDVLVTDALRSAGTGVAAADDSPASDRWGSFYSAYAPVFDSKGEIAGIVGIDFDAAWYDEQIRSHMISIILFTVLSVVIGSLLVFLITNRVRKKFNELSEELSDLSSNVDILMDELSAYSGFKPTHSAETMVPDDNIRVDEMEILSSKIRMMQNDMSSYLEHLHEKAYTDSLTMVKNTSAYHERIHELDKKIEDGSADFSVIVFDLNNLKKLNDNLGHECGDAYILGAASTIALVFGDSDTYRIGGDEFTAILEGIGEEEIHKRIKEVQDVVHDFHLDDGNSFAEELSLAIGFAICDPERDKSFKDVFARADQAMYVDKRKFHQKENTVE